MFAIFTSHKVYTQNQKIPSSFKYFTQNIKIVNTILKQCQIERIAETN